MGASESTPAGPPKFKIVYFPIRGRAEAVRLLLEDLEVPYEVVAPTPDWPTYKKAHTDDGTLAFGQLPQFIDVDGASWVQSGAMLRMLARRHKVIGSTEKLQMIADVAADGVEDMRREYLKTIYGDYDGTIEALKKEGMPKWYGHFENMIKRNGGEFLAGAEITYADYSLFDMLENWSRINAQHLDAFPTLKAYHARMAARPKIAAYLASGRRPDKVNGNTRG
eukprot:tig00021281_g19927.t1